MTKISIIIPAYNEEKYIGKLLKTCVNQTIPQKDYEIIISDANSTDWTVKIAKKYTNKILKKKTINPAQGRNYGAKHSKGKILVFLDADILLKKDSLNKILKKVDSGFVAGSFFFKPINGNFFYKLILLIINFLEKYLNPIIKTTNGPCMFIKKNIFEKINGFNEKLDVGEDNDLFRRASKHGKTGFINDYLKMSIRRVRKEGWFKLIIVWTYGLFKPMFSKEIKQSSYWDNKR